MESTSISDVRRMCQRGAFRAYVQGGKVFLEDTATGQVVPLNGENSPANTERRAAQHREDRRGSRKCPAETWEGRQKRPAKLGTERPTQPHFFNGGALSWHRK